MHFVNDMVKTIPRLIQYLFHKTKWGKGPKSYKYHLLFSIKYYFSMHDLFNSEQQKKQR